MERICKFYKENTGKWYIDLPEWEFGKEALEMVYGADDLLEILGESKPEVTLKLSDNYFDGSLTLDFLQTGVLGDDDFGGGTYFLESFKDKKLNLNLWLCDVTVFVFGDLPKQIFFQIV